MHPISSTPSFHSARPPAPVDSPDGTGKSAQSVGHRAKAAVAAAQEAGLEVPKNAQGFAASMIAKGADPETLFAALVKEPPAEVPIDEIEPAVADLDANDPVESTPVEGAPVESGPGEEPASSDSAPIEDAASPPEPSDEPEVDIVDPAIDLANAALTDDEVALELLSDILDQPNE
ncbi:MAG: hypothetical protein ACU0DI_04535 [Paracoccaceae bacterium]